MGVGPFGEEISSVFLLIIQSLAEESFNAKLITDTSKRLQCRQDLKASSDKVNAVLLEIARQTQAPKIMQLVMKCFGSWMRLCEITCSEQLISNPLFGEAFVQFLKSPDSAEVAADIIEESCRLIQDDFDSFRELSRFILLRICQPSSEFLSACLNTLDSEDEESSLQFARIYCSLAESLPKDYLSNCISEKRPEIMVLFDVLTRLTRFRIHTVSNYTLSFWREWSDEVRRLVRGEPESTNGIEGDHRVTLEAALLALSDSCQIHRQLGFEPPEIKSTSESISKRLDSDYQVYRATAADCISEIVQAMDSVHVVSVLINQLRHAADPLAVEGCLFVLGNALHCVRPNVDKFPELWQLISDLPNMCLAPRPLDFASQYMRGMCIYLIGLTGTWAVQKPALLWSSIECMALILVNPVDNSILGPAAPVKYNPDIQAVASRTFRQLCLQAKHVLARQPDLQNTIGQLVNVLTQSFNCLAPDSHILVCEGVAAVLSETPSPAFDQLYADYLGQLIFPLVREAKSGNCSGRVLADLLDRITVVVREQKIRSTSSRASTIMQLITNELFPLIQLTICSHREEELIVEKCCRLVKHTIRGVDELFRPLTRAWAELIVVEFDQRPHSSYLYAAELLVDTYRLDPEVEPVLKGLFERMCSKSLNVLTQARNEGRLRFEVKKRADDEVCRTIFVLFYHHFSRLRSR